MKFRGAGQGPLALVAEIIAGELARRLGLRVPELVLAGLDPRIAVSEPDPEIQDLLRASEGMNLGVDFLPGSFGFEPLGWTAGPEFAIQVLWFDALVQNVDRTWRNPNLLVWHLNIWLIDQGAALSFHHNWPTADPMLPFDAAAHVLSVRATALVPAPVPVGARRQAAQRHPAVAQHHPRTPRRAGVPVVLPPDGQLPLRRCREDHQPAVGHPGQRQTDRVRPEHRLPRRPGLRDLRRLV